MAINFWCAECGNPLAAEDAEAGRRTTCGKCGAVVSVPRNLPALEPEQVRGDPADLWRVALDRLPENDAAAARGGLAFLLASLAVFALAAAAWFAAWFMRVRIDGPGAAFGGVPVAAQWVTTAAVWGVIAAVSAGAVLRVVGYLRCRGAGHWLDADLYLTFAAVGAVTFAGGAVVLATMDLGGPALVFAPGVQLFALLAALLTLAGAGGEFCAVVFLRRLMTSAENPGDRRRVVIYLTTFIVSAVILGVVGYAAYWFYLLVRGFRGGAAPPVFGVQEYTTVYTFLLAFATALILLVAQYARLLARGRTLLLPRPVSLVGDEQAS